MRQHTSNALLPCITLSSYVCIAALTLQLCGPVAAAAAELTAKPGLQPVQRLIVPDLTLWLRDTLQEHNVSLLLVLPSSSPPDDTPPAMKIGWQNLTLNRVEYISSFQDVHNKLVPFLHQQFKSHAAANNAAATQVAAELQPATAAASDPVSAGTGNSQYQRHSRKHHQQRLSSQLLLPSVALLVQGSIGKVAVKQMQLSAAISKRLRHSLALSLSYSSHSDKGDSIVMFNSDGAPQKAVFLSTSVFRDAFTAIYDKQIWGSGGGGSGEGSRLVWTSTLRSVLPNLISKYNIRSMLDSSCGSLFWMPLVLNEVAAKQPDFKYMGTDVVCSLISKHQVTHANQSNWQFQCIDYANQPLPSGYDLVFSRDSLQHLPLHGTWQFLNNVKASGAKWLLVGSYVRSAAPNADIPAGSYYDIDLMKPPFSVWPPPVELINEGTPDGKHMLLFDVQKVTWQDPLLGLL